jgi:hypothetical protein
MKLKAIRGKNQFGYSFVSDPEIMLEAETVLLKFGPQIVYTILRVSENVPSNVIIIDYRIFDMLGCNEEDEVDIKSIDAVIPLCGDIALSLCSVIGLDNEKVAAAISKRIEDLKPHLDGLIVKEGQIIRIHDLKIEFVVKHVEPRAKFDRVSRISWSNLLRISIDPKKTMPCYNLVLLLDLGVIIENDSVANHNRKVVIINHIVRTLIEDMYQCKEISLFSSIAYSESSQIFKTYDSTTGQKIDFSPIDASSLVTVHENWFREQVKACTENVVDPGNALKKGIELATTIYNENSSPTIILLCSGGKYTSGSNPVKIARMVPNSEIGIFCAAISDEADTELLNAIAQAGNGEMVHMLSIDDYSLLTDTFHHWMMKR